MSLTKWELEVTENTKTVTLTFNKVVKVSTDVRSGDFIVSVTMSGVGLSKPEYDLIDRKYDA